MELVYFSNSATINPLWQQVDKYSIQHLNNVVDIQHQTKLQDPVFIIDGIDLKFCMNVLEYLRHDRTYYSAPLFVTNRTSDPIINMIADGIVKSPREVFDRAHQILVMNKNLVDLGNEPTQDEKLLRFLYTRPFKRIQPVESWPDQQMYQYPLLNIFSEEQSHTSQWLENLTERKLLQPLQLIDRLRLCTSCNSVNLHFIERCPHCHSIDILKNFIRCLACDRVFIHKNILQSGRIKCPHCDADQQKMSLDRDQVYEVYHCRDCDSVGAEAEVIAKCLHCGTQSEMPLLNVKSIFSYQLSEYGKMITKAGRLEDIYQVFNFSTYIPFSQFEQTVDWQLKLFRRHHVTAYFSLFALRITNIPDLISVLGRAKVAQLMDRLAHNLRQDIREIDLISRNHDNTLWLLLPHAGRESCGALAERLLSLISNCQPPANQHHNMDVCFVHYTTSKETNPNETAPLLLTNLTNQLIGQARPVDNSLG